VTVNKVDAPLAVEGEDAVPAGAQLDGAVAVAQIFALKSRVAEIAVLAVPEVIGVLAVLAANADVMRDGRFAEKFPQLWEDRLSGLEIRPRRIGAFHPLVFVPYGVRTVQWVDGNDGLARLVAGTFVQSPVLPEGSKMQQTVERMQGWFTFYFQFGSQCHLLRRWLEGLAGEGAGGHGSEWIIE